ncbi:hypothetical protein AMS68_001253 [Peltaster fructicola]|uniref:Impact N-terminal domain-containing protein n=1 Tax=Peltaster fructicola TaxID=286661 RepID=A0A6H0XM04_9PEZI|nr:hypothetical protein AMS68_001253 [Peltaster fructicola]
MSATEIQAFIRFLAQDAKVPIGVAVSKIKDLQQAGLGDVSSLAKSDVNAIKVIFPDDKLAKQILNAAKRVSKKRAAGNEATSSPVVKRSRDESMFSLPKEESAEQLEKSLQLPYSDASAEELAGVKLFSNRAPLVLAMTVMLLKYTMPEQPLSSRLSLAQGYVSTTSRSRAVNLGLEVGKSADEEGYGEGQPITSIMGKELRVLRRWGYEAKLENTAPQAEDKPTIKSENDTAKDGLPFEEAPALWSLDLEAMRKAKTGIRGSSSNQYSNTSNMPIHTPQSARAYLLKSFEKPAVGETGKKLNAAQIIKQKEDNLGHLLRAIDLLYASWIGFITPDDLEKRVWGWYVKARPAVESGVAGWGGKNVWSLADILVSRRSTRGTLDSFIKKENKD